MIPSASHASYHAVGNLLARMLHHILHVSPFADILTLGSGESNSYLSEQHSQDETVSAPNACVKVYTCDFTLRQLALQLHRPSFHSPIKCCSLPLIPVAQFLMKCCSLPLIPVAQFLMKYRCRTPHPSSAQAC
jgi:hypothetical protein